MKRKMYVDDFLRGRIDGHLQCGRTYTMEIFEKLEIVQSVILRFRQRFQDYENISRRYKTGCPRIITPKQTEQGMRLVTSALCSNSKTEREREFQGKPCIDV
ncbi:hypothetical protein TNCV_3721171 [Trichonephila clavipes]|nr:hypothetical protein TNCV_3721171 [Trichonephila clavipes]